MVVKAGKGRHNGGKGGEGLGSRGGESQTSRERLCALGLSKRAAAYRNNLTALTGRGQASLGTGTLGVNAQITYYTYECLYSSCTGRHPA